MKTIKSYFTGINRMKYLLGVLIALIVSDGLISHFLVARGLGREVNPFLQTLVGKEAFLVIKVVGALIVAFILWDIHKRRPKLAMISTSCFVAVCAGIVLWNLRVFFITQG